jgi:hypothetical protein
MRQTHVAGDKLFVDWAGDTVPIRLVFDLGFISPIISLHEQVFPCP